MHHTLMEIQKQPTDWGITIDVILREADQWRELFADKNYENVYFTGCGTSYYIAIAAAYAFQEVTGLKCRAIPASEVLLLPDSIFHRNQRNLLIAVGRSGTTTESVEAIRTFREDGYGDSLSIACRASAPASAAATYAIELEHVFERSVVMTGTFTNLLLATQVLGAVVAGNGSLLDGLKRLPEVGGEVLKRAQAAAEKYGNDTAIRQFIYLGLGAFYGLASEAVLKLKEMTQTPTEAYNPLEFRHGPISIVESETLVVLFQSDKAPQVEALVLEDVRNLGGQTLLVCDAAADQQCLALGVNLPDTVRAILYLPFAQYLGYYRSLALGLDPDKPRNLSQVVTLSL